MKPFSDNETVSLPRGSLNHTWICDLNPLLPIDVHYYLPQKKSIMITSSMIITQHQQQHATTTTLMSYLSAQSGPLVLPTATP